MSRRQWIAISILTFLVASVALAYGFRASFLELTGQATVTFHVVDSSTGQPIGNPAAGINSPRVTVYLAGNRLLWSIALDPYTGNSLPQLTVPTGQPLWIQVSAAGHTIVWLEQTVTTTTNFNFQLSSTTISSGTAVPVDVTVMDQGSGQPIQGATVTFAGASVQNLVQTTSAQGLTSFTYVPFALQMMSVQANNYDTVSQSMNVGWNPDEGTAKGRPMIMKIYLSKVATNYPGTGTLTIHVQDATSGAAMQWANVGGVILVDPSTKTAGVVGARTDAYGNAIFNSVVPGTQIVNVMAGSAGYAANWQSVQVAATATNSATVKMVADTGQILPTPPPPVLQYPAGISALPGTTGGSSSAIDLTTCTPPSPLVNAPVNHFDFQVVTAGNQGIGQTQIKMGQALVVTDAQGHAVTNGVGSGIQTLTVTAPGYAVLTKQVKVSSSCSAAFKFIMSTTPEVQTSVTSNPAITVKVYFYAVDAVTQKPINQFSITVNEAVIYVTDACGFATLMDVAPSANSPLGLDTPFAQNMGYKRYTGGPGGPYPPGGAVVTGPSKVILMMAPSSSSLSSTVQVQLITSPIDTSCGTPPPPMTTTTPQTTWQQPSAKMYINNVEVTNGQTISVIAPVEFKAVITSSTPTVSAVRVSVDGIAYSMHEIAGGMFLSDPITLDTTTTHLVRFDYQTSTQSWLPLGILNIGNGQGWTTWTPFVIVVIIGLVVVGAAIVYKRRGG